MAEPQEFSPAWFDASSAAWLANKRKLGNCTYRYTCDYQYSTWRRCGRDVYKTESMCRQHWALAQKTATNAAKKTSESPKYD
jgi:hypothetical protein